MAFDLKGATPDTTFPAGGFLFGADSQAATDPSIYSDATFMARFNLFAGTNTLELRNGVNSQKLHVYGTYTDASNYERAVFDHRSSIDGLFIITEAAGTGSVRPITIGTTSARTTLRAQQDNLEFSVGGGTFKWGRESVSTGALTLNNLVRPTGMMLAERSAPGTPPANNVVIYAEDDGAGKTRLMALFPTGAAQQIAIEP